MTNDKTRTATRLLAADAAAIEDAARVMRDGGLVAFPTETVYGLGADAGNSRAVAALYAAKGRPSFNPLIAHFRTFDAARKAGKFGELAEKLAATFWPGPLTIVVNATFDSPVCELARAGLTTVALRVPAHPVAQALLTEAGFPIVAPSANRSGHVSPTTARHVIDDLNGKIDVVLDGGATQVGIESTIIDCSGEQPRLLRSGGISREAIEVVIGTLAERNDERLVAPGMLPSHYAPRAALRLDAKEVRAGEGLLSFGRAPLANSERAAEILNLSPDGDVVEAASNLYAYLRALDAAKLESIAVAEIPNIGLGEAIRDRLQRAAAPRE